MRCASPPDTSCVDSGAENALLEIVDRQNGIASPGDWYLPPNGYHRDRVPTAAT